jgi:hypothetical protein
MTKIQDQDQNFHLPLPNLSIYQRGTYYNGIKVLNNLPPDIKKLSHNVKQFSLALKRFRHTKSFYSLDEYFNSRTKIFFRDTTHFNQVTAYKIKCW